MLLCAPHRLTWRASIGPVLLDASDVAGAHHAHHRLASSLQAALPQSPARRMTGGPSFIPQRQCAHRMYICKHSRNVPQEHILSALNRLPVAHGGMLPHIRHQKLLSCASLALGARPNRAALPAITYKPQPSHASTSCTGCTGSMAFDNLKQIHPQACNPSFLLSYHTCMLASPGWPCPAPTSPV